MPTDNSNSHAETAVLSTTTWNNVNKIYFYTENIKGVDNPNAPYPSSMYSQVMYIGI